MSAPLQQRPARRWRSRRRTRRWAGWVIDIAIAAVALGPILWGLSTSLKPAPDILAYPPEFIPSRPTLEHYALLFRTGIHHFVLNSAIVSTAAVVLSLALGSLAAYALARMAFTGKAAVMFAVMALMSIPLPSVLVPTFTLLASIGLTNSLTGLALLYTAYQLPIVVWLLYGYFGTLPVELEHAARIDGCTRLQTLRKVVLPLSGPGLVASALFVLTFAWNDFVVAVVMTSSEDVKTLPVAIYGYLGFYGRDWGPLTASAMLSIVPVIAVFIAFQRYFLSGMTGGSIKG
ncbi:carbohydrate ABC transporter permease [uncultured Alsobacter sp.]|uniref:carbohydrate ABC transporter permease n=1 Tax=uncultured Alsobacter sp. TaxID=1748258 RepID=UPI0025F87DB9|nr:carbohydrate ABC transporter permease [uncultured Alsobacter sp.]